MAHEYKPPAYTSVAPYLIVEGAAHAIAFLTNVFGAVELRRFSSPDGGIRHAEVRIDDTIVMIADSVAGWPPAPAHVHVYVADVDAVWQRALAAGATPIQEPVKKEDDDKRGGLKDASGTTWWIATKVA